MTYHCNFCLIVFTVAIFVVRAQSLHSCTHTCVICATVFFNIYVYCCFMQSVLYITTINQQHQQKLSKNWELPTSPWYERTSERKWACKNFLCYDASNERRQAAEIQTSGVFCFTSVFVVVESYIFFVLLSLLTLEPIWMRCVFFFIAFLFPSFSSYFSFYFSRIIDGCNEIKKKNEEIYTDSALALE